MNFCNFQLKYTRKKRCKVLDDRPFNSIIEFDQSKQKLINTDDSEDKTSVWVTCTKAANDSDDGDFNINSNYNFKSFSHYFDEPIYSEPDFKPKTEVISEANGPHYDLLTITQGIHHSFSESDDNNDDDHLTISEGRYHCSRPPSSDSDYESFSVDKAPTDLENCQGRNSKIVEYRNITLYHFS